MRAYTDYILDHMSDEEWEASIRLDNEREDLADIIFDPAYVADWSSFIDHATQEDDRDFGSIEDDHDWIRTGC
jgi:hypothetical protein